jgi:hypothetical protein
MTQGFNNVGWTSEPITRGTASLLFNCISTTLICTWSALHLNVPAEGRSAISTLVTKIRLFSLAIVVAPEYFVACAIREWRAARTLTKRMRDILPVRSLLFFQSVAMNYVSRRQWLTAMYTPGEACMVPLVQPSRTHGRRHASNVDYIRHPEGDCLLARDQQSCVTALDPACRADSSVSGG